MNDRIEINPGDRDYSPKIELYVAEHGEDHYSDDFDSKGRLSFQTYEEAKNWLCKTLHKDDVNFQQLDSSTWRAEVNYGPWAEIRKTRITQPVRLLRDDRKRIVKQNE